MPNQINAVYSKGILWISLNCFCNIEEKLAAKHILACIHAAPGWLYLHSSVESRPQWICGKYVNISVFSSQGFLYKRTSWFCAKRRPEDN